MRTYPLSPLHQQQLDASGQSAGTAFHTRQLSLSFGEAVDRGQFVAAWQDLTTTHPILRTTLDPTDPTQWQESDDDITEWRELDWQTDPPADLGFAWNELAAADSSTPLTTGHRLTTIVLPSGDLHLLWSYDDLLIDETAVRYLLVEWLLRYEGGTRDAAPDDPAAAFAALTGHDSEEASWQAHFHNAPAARPLILFPLPDENAPSTRRATVFHTFEREHGQTLAVAAKSMGVTPIDLVEAAWALLLAPALSSDEVTLLATFRLPVTAVARSETRVPRRHRLTPEAKVSAWAQAVAQSRADAATVGTWTTEQIAAALPGEGAAVIRPAAAFRYRPGDLNDHLHSCLPRWLGADAQFLGHDAAPLALVYTASDRASVAIDFDPGLFTESAANSLLKRWIAIIAQLIADPDRPLREITITLPGEPTLVAGPDAAPPFRSLVPQCLHELFDETATDLGERTALDSDTETLTFEELNQQSNQVARHLRKLNVAARSTVAIHPGYSSHWPAVILGIWKAGAAISIFDKSVNYKDKSFSKNAIPKLALSEDPSITEGATQLEEFWQKASSEKTRGIPGDVSATDPAVRFADGLTVSHEQAGRLCQAAAVALTVGPDDRLLQSAPTHDLETLAEVFGTLLSGATVVLPASGGWSTRTAFQEFADQHAVTVMSVPTPFWSEWTHYLTELSLPAPASIRRAVIRGGRISPAALTSWSVAAPTATILHASSGFHAPNIALEGPIPAGPAAPRPAHPAAGAVARITWHDTPLPPGFPGRLEIGSAEGTLTPTDRETFLDASGSFYSRNEIESVIRPGFATSRLETIERVVFEHREIFDCAVARTDSGTWNVWIVPADSQRGEPIDFRDHLEENLPDLKFAVACIPRLPLTPDGQLDRNALPPPTRERQLARPSPNEDTPSAPPSEEAKLASILSRALGGRELDSDTTITDSATKPRVAQHLHETLQRAGYADAQLEDFQRVFSVRSLRREWRSRQSAGEGEWNPLKPLRAAGAAVPLIVFHDYPGTAELYRELTLQLGEEQPVYAITARTITNPTESIDVADLATTYARAIREFDDGGPYRLLGFGFGGMLALETARRLIHQGQEIEFLALLATEPPRTSRGLTGGFRRIFGKKSPPTPRPGDSAIVTAHRQASFRHKVESLDITTHIFLPEEDFPAVEDAQNDWTEICDDARFYQIPCAPADLLEEPAVSAIAETITNLLDEETE